MICCRNKPTKIDFLSSFFAVCLLQCCFGGYRSIYHNQGSRQMETKFFLFLHCVHTFTRVLHTNVQALSAICTYFYSKTHLSHLLSPFISLIRKIYSAFFLSPLANLNFLVLTADVGIFMGYSGARALILNTRNKVAMSVLC